MEKLFVEPALKLTHNHAINYAPAAPDARTSRRLLRSLGKSMLRDSCPNCNNSTFSVWAKFQSLGHPIVCSKCGGSAKRPATLTAVAIIILYVLWFLESDYKLAAIGLAAIVVLYEGMAFKLEPYTGEVAWNRKLRNGTIIGLLATGCVVGFLYFFYEVFIAVP